MVNLGSFLTPTTNSSWLSRSGLYAFGFYQQANGYAIGVFLAGIPEKTVVWTANRDDPPVLADATLNFTIDGRIILQSAQGKETNIANPSDGAIFASMLDSGNFVLYNSNNKITWQSFDIPTNTLLQGQRLTAGEELVSSVSESDQSTGIFRLKMQIDGNLVQYPVQTSDTAPYSYWTSWTGGKGDNVSLCLDDDGHLYLLNTNTYLKNLTQGGYRTKDTVYLMRIDVDGIFRLFSHNLVKNGNWSVIWSSSDNKCDPKGLCGLNGFCTSIGGEAICSCIPGFARVNQGKWSSGCERNFTAESCKSKDGSINYTMEPISNIEWEFNNSFSILPLLTKEECRAACLEDCNCEAAMYKDSTCQKLKLPFKYGRIVLSDSNIAFIKVDIEKMTNHFKEELGRGAFGSVYKGTILNGQKLVAVKRLGKALAEGEKEFLTEIKVIGRTHHKNLVHLLGYCHDGENRLLLLKPDQTNTFTGIRGTKGYVAPEWHRKQPITIKVDVYSFGIVLLELICCRKNVDCNLPEEEAILEEWAYHCFEAHELGKLVSGKEVDKRQLERMVKVGLWCILDDPSLRPTIKKVLLMLEGNLDIPIPPSSTSSLSIV
nr:g-type lectin s-receptor-like serine/threonine-protein kinase lecrk3 [Quercus suber]